MLFLNLFRDVPLYVLKSKEDIDTNLEKTRLRSITILATAPLLDILESKCIQNIKN